MYNLYLQRSFGDKFDTVVGWLRENWKTVLALQAVFFLPIAIVQAIGQTSVFSFSSRYASVGDIPTSISVSLILYYVCAIIGIFLSSALNMAIVKHSFIEKGTPDELSLSVLWSKAKSLMPRLFFSYIVLIALFTLLVVVAALLAFISSLTLLLTVPIIVYLAFAVLPFLPLYLFTDEPIMEALVHSLRLGTKCWGGFFATNICMAILVQLVALLFAVPFYLFLVFGTLFSGNILVQCGLYLTSVLLIFTSYCLQIASFLIISVQYGHAVAKVDGVMEE